MPSTDDFIAIHVTAQIVCEPIKKLIKKFRYGLPDFVDYGANNGQ